MKSQEIEFREAWRAIANAKLNEYRAQSLRLARLTRRGVVDKLDAVDLLREIALAHALVRALGEDRIEEILADAFGDADFRPMVAEVA